MLYEVITQLEPGTREYQRCFGRKRQAWATGDRYRRKYADVRRLLPEQSRGAGIRQLLLSRRARRQGARGFL